MSLTRAARSLFSRAGPGRLLRPFGHDRGRRANSIGNLPSQIWKRAAHSPGRRLAVLGRLCPLLVAKRSLQGLACRLLFRDFRGLGEPFNISPRVFMPSGDDNTRSPRNTRPPGTTVAFRTAEPESDSYLNLRGSPSWLLGPKDEVVSPPGGSESGATFLAEASRPADRPQVVPLGVAVRPPGGPADDLCVVFTSATWRVAVHPATSAGGPSLLFVPRP